MGYAGLWIDCDGRTTLSDAYVLIGIGIVLLLIVGLLIRYARRVDRLHRRVIQAHTTLDKRLRERRETVAALVANSQLDSADIEELTAALEAANRVSDEQSESSLTRALRRYRNHAGSQLAENPQLARDLSDIAVQLSSARRFYNQEVEQVRRIRSRIFVRLFHLAGRAELPQTYDMDDRY